MTVSDDGEMVRAAMEAAQAVMRRMVAKPNRAQRRAAAKQQRKQQR